VVSCQAKSKPHAMGTPAVVLSVCWPSSSGTIVANPRLRRVAAIASFRCVGWHSSIPSPCWLPLDTGCSDHTYSLLSPKAREPRNTPKPRKHGITVGGFVFVCSACSVVKSGIATQAQDHLPNGVGLLHQVTDHDLW
jgi:hypothetical protein